MSDLRRALINLLHSDVIHVWPPEEIVDYFILPLVHDAYNGVEDAIREGWDEFAQAAKDEARRRRWAWTEREKSD